MYRWWRLVESNVNHRALYRCRSRMHHLQVLGTGMSCPTFSYSAFFQIFMLVASNLSISYLSLLSKHSELKHLHSQILRRCRTILPWIPSHARERESRKISQRNYWCTTRLSICIYSKIKFLKKAIFLTIG